MPTINIMANHMTEPTRPMYEFAKLVILAAMISIAVAAVSWIPAAKWGGADGLLGMGVGIGISFAAAVVAGLPIIFVRGRTPADRQLAVMGAMAVRMFATLAAFLIAALLKIAPLKPMAVGLCANYLVLLAVETTVFVKLVRGRETGLR